MVGQRLRPLFSHAERHTMAAYKNPAGGAGEDLYSDASSDAAEPQTGPAEMPEEETPDNGYATYTLPIEALEGKDLKPGDELMLEVVRINEDSVEVKCIPENKEEEPAEPPEAAAPPAAAGGEMAGMME